MKTGISSLLFIHKNIIPKCPLEKLSYSDRFIVSLATDAARERICYMCMCARTPKCRPCYGNVRSCLLFPAQEDGGLVQALHLRRDDG